MLKYDELPLNNNDIFLSCSSGEIKWKDLDQELDEKIEILKEHGIGPHVIFIIAEEVKSIDDFLWILASAKNGGSASQASSKQSQLEINSLVKDSNACCIIRSGNIKMLHEPKEPTVLPYEIYRGMTSGTTIKPIFELYPYFWNVEDHLKAFDENGENLRGATNNCNKSLYKMAPEFKQDVRPICLSPGGFESTYNPWNLLRMYAMGGRLHFLNESTDNVPEEIERVKPNLIMSYPNAIKRVVDACPDNFNASIDYWEFAGGHVCGPTSGRLAVGEKRKAGEGPWRQETEDRGLIYDINQKFKFKVLYNLMGSTESDMHIRAEYRPGDRLENFYGFKFGREEYYGELKVDDDGIMWYKYGNLDWRTDGDKMKVDGDRWYYDGRAFDDIFIIKGGVKVYTGLVEAKALELPGVAEVSSVGKEELHFLIYTGTTNIHELHKHVLELQPYKRPHDIYHVTEKLYYGGETKLQKRRLPELLEKFPEEILDTINVKDHKEI